MKRFFVIVLLAFAVFLASCQAGTEVSPDPLQDADGDIKVYAVTYTNSEGGSINGTLEQRVKEGENALTVVAVAAEGYKFVKWSDGFAEPVRTDRDVKSDILVSPIFEKKDERKTVSGTPIIRIYTENQAEIKDKENYVGCTVSVSGTDEEFCIESVDAGIRGRGNSTWDHHEKKSYRIKFDSKRSMFGSDYEAKSWTLIANHADRTLSRNALVYEMAEQFDDIAFTSMHQHVEVYLNDEYQGMYLFCDQMQTGDGRVDVDEDMTGDPDMGYLIELDCRASWEGTANIDYFVLDYEKQYAMKTPDPDDEGYDPDIYLTYIKNYMSDCLNALSDQDWNEICKLMDVNSFADVYIIQELFANHDCASYSFYFYKEKGGKLHCGPVWDFDLSVGNGYYGAGDDNSYAPDSDLGKNGELIAASSNTWFRRLLRNEEFRAIVKAKLVKYDAIIKEVISLADPEAKSGYYAKYGSAMERNFERWDILGKYVWPNNKEVYSIETVTESFDYVVDWLTERYRIIRNEFGVK